MRTRFAPSPTGPLHLGHAFSAIVASNLAREQGGEFLLRIEDIDRSRARPEWEDLIFEDLSWLGLDWPTPVLRQSDRMPAYTSALTDLWDRGLLFACTCRRRDLESAAAAPQEGAPILGPDGLVYPGTCRHRKKSPGLPHPPADAALRLDMAAALATLPSLTWQETGEDRGERQVRPDTAIENIGDVVVARREMGTSYHLAVVLDDAFQQITHVTRGLDLAEATAIHVILQALLSLPTPVYHHHRLIRDASGRRLAKRDDARAIRSYRAAGRTPQDIYRMVGLAV